MQIKVIIILIFSSLLSHIAVAELPKRGALMDSVQAEFGSPVSSSDTVGQPPITRWYYESFTVVFEYEHVIHAFPRNTSVENLSVNNTDGLVLPDTVAPVETETENTTAAEEAPTSLGDSFFKDTPDLIR